MRPSRLAAVVLVVYVLLPIRADLFASLPAPANSNGLAAELPTAPVRLSTQPLDQFGLVREEAILPSEEQERYARHARVKCLYFDWFYDTGGMWVSTDGLRSSNHRFGLDRQISGLT